MPGRVNKIIDFKQRAKIKEQRQMTKKTPRDKCLPRCILFKLQFKNQNYLLN